MMVSSLQPKYQTSCCGKLKDPSVLTIGYLDGRKQIICTDECFFHAASVSPEEIRAVAMQNASRQKRFEELLRQGKSLGVLVS